MKKDRDITIYDIAHALRISATTVSRGLKDHPAISKETKKKILKTAEQMGYRFNASASNLRMRRSNTIGVIVPRLNSSFMADVIAGIESVVNQTAYNLLISQSLETMSKEISGTKTMFTNRVDGLLVSLAYDTSSIDHFIPFLNKGIPVIFFDRVIEHKLCPNITIDNYKAGYELTVHLIEQGCKKLAHVTGNLLRNVYAERYNGFLQALADYNIPFHEKYLVINNLSLSEGHVAADTFMQLPEPPDGIFVANDACAVGLMLQLKKSGIQIPQDIAVAGFNNDAMAAVVEPHLTTINYKGYEMGEITARLLTSYLDNQSDLQQTGKIVLRSELIIRESSLKKR
ncbi:LacI family transcriptional regulator (plasmid) [Pedobacter sp. BS3]|uniref:LacI family DNA-binding transcriptional regulator n=1 Tax=Pedobacter sp. BS3 TaxID=2567937 RepID=UPI0011F00D47|nr:LacI family DNA-binding transcriptional regulator [Pedobacter sp. BS3]TZF85606.1 LacI family transcriptional regulator [Pedobacter sp. BS3]